MNICRFIIDGFDYPDKQNFVEACAKLNPQLKPKQVIAQQLAAQPKAPVIPVVVNQPVNPAGQKQPAPKLPPQSPATIIPQKVVQQQTNAPGQQPQQPAAPSKTPTGGSEPTWFETIIGIFSGIGSIFSGFVNWIRSLLP